MKVCRLAKLTVLLPRGCIVHGVGGCCTHLLRSSLSPHNKGLNKLLKMSIVCKPGAKGLQKSKGASSFSSTWNRNSHWLGKGTGCLVTDEQMRAKQGRVRVTLSPHFQQRGPENQERHTAKAQGHNAGPRLRLNQNNRR